jgi:hypothetical protein
VFTRLLLLAASALVMASALPYALFWGMWLLLSRLIKKVRRMKHVRVRAVPLFAVLSFLLVLFAFTKVTDNIGTFNFWSFLVWIMTMLFMVLSLVGLALAVSVPRAEMHKAERIYSQVVSSACCVVMLFFSGWHLIGLRLWAP